MKRRACFESILKAALWKHMDSKTWIMEFSMFGWIYFEWEACSQRSVCSRLDCGCQKRPERKSLLIHTLYVSERSPWIMAVYFSSLIPNTCCWCRCLAGNGWESVRRFWSYFVQFEFLGFRANLKRKARVPTRKTTDIRKSQSSRDKTNEDVQVFVLRAGTSF